jgi:hypothetical protein
VHEIKLSQKCTETIYKMMGKTQLKKLNKRDLKNSRKLNETDSYIASDSDDTETVEFNELQESSDEEEIKGNRKQKKFR